MECNVDFFYLDNGNPSLVGGTFRDVTETKWIREEMEKYRVHLEDLVKQRTSEIEDAHLEIAESQRTLTNLISQLPGMVYRRRNDPEFTMLFVSQGCSGADRVLGGSIFWRQENIF